MTEAVLSDPPAAEPVAVASGPLADLILVRLLPDTKSRPSPRTVRDDVGRLFPRPPSADTFSATLDDLRATGLIAAKGQVLTDAGRSRALAYLDVDSLPQRCTWGTLKAKYLVAKALGLRPGVTPLTGKKLTALLLKRKYALPVGTPDSVKGALEALACRLLGFEDCARIADVVPKVIAREELDGSEPRSLDEFAKCAPAALLDAPRPGRGWQEAVALAGLFGPSAAAALPARVEPAEPADEAFDLEAFANTVRAAARDCPTGRHGDDKVWINHVWRQLYDQPPIGGLGFDGFKARLAEANRQRLLTLSRADLGPLLDPVDVRESELHAGGGVFHFVLIRGA